LLSAASVTDKENTLAGYFIIGGADNVLSPEIEALIFY